MADQQEITATDKAWLAGVIEGDGSIGMGFHQQHDRKKNGSRAFAVKPAITFANQDMKLIERVAFLLESITGKVPRIKEERSNYPNGRGCVQLYLTGMQAVDEVLRALLPYFVGDKLSKARLLQRFTASRLNGAFGKGIKGIAEYSNDELVIIKTFYEVTAPRKGGKRNPVIGEILRDFMCAPG